MYRITSFYHIKTKIKSTDGENSGKKSACSMHMRPFVRKNIDIYGKTNAWRGNIMNKKFSLAAVAAVFLLNIVLILALTETLAPDALTYSRGSSGDGVRTIQTKLKRWGYYTGEVDGIYGSKTVEAVKYFQRTNGLAVDGICGEKTLAALGISDGSSGSSGGAGGSRENDMALLARIITAESESEPYLGQVAVGAVILNRVQHPSFPNTLSGVIFQKGAFSPISDGRFYSVTVTASARKAAQDAMNGYDPTGGAVYFYNPRTSTSKWIFSRETVMTVGNHVFAK